MFLSHLHDFRLFGSRDLSFKAMNASTRGHRKDSIELKSEAAIWPLWPLEPLNQQEKKGVTMPAAVVDPIKKKIGAITQWGSRRLCLKYKRSLRASLCIPTSFD